MIEHDPMTCPNCGAEVTNNDEHANRDDFDVVAAGYTCRTVDWRARASYWQEQATMFADEWAELVKLSIGTSASVLVAVKTWLAERDAAIAACEKLKALLKGAERGEMTFVESPVKVRILTESSVATALSGQEE